MFVSCKKSNLVSIRRGETAEEEEEVKQHGA